MKTHILNTKGAFSRFALKGALVLLAGTTLAACQTVGNQQSEGIGFRQARFAEVEALRGYRACRDDALKLDEQARKTSNPGQYLASARLLESCEADLGPEADGIAPEERMRAYALSVQNHMKGGDLSAARANLENFKRAFPGQDLYLTGGASFLDTYSVLFDFGRATPYTISVANIGEPLRDEVRRTRHWKQN
ncbi:hypothetical protein JCM17960_00330 [Magnetospira thiophila]